MYKINSKFMNDNTENDFTFDFKDIYDSIIDNFFKILLSTLLVSIISIIVSLRIIPIYTSEAVLFPADKKNSSSGLLQSVSQLGGLVGLGGSNVDDTNSLLAVELIKSRSFLEEFIKTRDLMLPLLASKNWSIDSEEYEINEEIYDFDKNEWKSETPIDEIALLYDAYVNLSAAIDIEEDRRTGIIKASLRHFSPYISRKWLTWLIEDINQAFKTKDANDAQLAINELTKAMIETDIPNLDLTYSSLIEQRLNKLTIANTKSNYVFEVIDPPYLAMQRTSPRRTLIVLSSTILAGAFFTILFLAISFFQKGRDS